MSIVDDTRAAWGAAPNTNPRPVAASRRVGISWHYDGGAALNLGGRPHSACLTRVKADQRFHQSSRGWADIGYNLLICQHGRVIEGRGVDLQGAHSPGVNDVHYGVQFMVGGSESPTPAAFARAVRLAGELAAHSGRSLRQWGHRDDPQASTECPGNLIEGWVKRQGNAAPSKPTSPTPSKPAAGGFYSPVAMDMSKGIDASELRPGKTNAHIARLESAIWNWRGDAFRKALVRNYGLKKRADLYNPEWTPMLSAMVGDSYKLLHRLEPGNGWLTTRQARGADPLPTWPGPVFLKRIGFKKVF